MPDFHLTMPGSNDNALFKFLKNAFHTNHFIQNKVMRLSNPIKSLADFDDSPLAACILDNNAFGNVERKGHFVQIIISPFLIFFDHEFRHSGKMEAIELTPKIMKHIAACLHPVH